MRSPVLVSRTAERARLRGALDELGEGRGGLWVLRGDPGIGKSRLASALAADAAEAGVEVLSGRAVPSGTPTPLRPLSEALLGWLRTHEVPDDRLLAPYLPTLARLAPQLGPVAPDAASSVMLLGEALLRLARTVPARGLLLLIEDLHWADPETLALVEYLADNTREVPLLVLVTSRLHESPAANELVTALQWRHSTEIVDLLPLADDDVAALARACLGDEPSDAVVAWLQRYSAGYPLFVEEMLADLSDAGQLDGPLPVLVPRPFARSVEARLAEVGPAGRELATAAAMLGAEFDWRLVAEALALSDTDVATALRELRDQRLVVAVPPDRFGFRHALTREAVLSGLLAPERARLAGLLAAALAGRSTDSADDHHQLAELFEAAGDDARAVELWLATARDAIGRGALVSAGEAIRRALRGCAPGTEPESRVREAEVEVHALAGDVPHALEAGERLAEELAGDPGRLAAVRIRLGRALLAGGRWDEAEAMLAVAAGHDPVQEDVLAARLALGREDDRAAAERATAVLAAVGEDRPEIACEAWEVLGRATRARDHVAGEEAFEAGYRIADAHDLPLWRCRLLAALGALDLAARRPTEERLVAARRVALDAGAIAVAARIEIDLNLVRIRYLDLDEAMAAIDNAISMMDRLRLPELPMAYLLRAATHGLAGRAEEMEADIATAGALPMDEALRLVGIPGHVRSFVALAHGRYDDARGQLATAMEYHRRTPSMPFSLRGFWALLETAHGDGTAAREEVRAGPQANSPHNAFALGYADAIALGRAGDRAGAERVFADAEWGLPGREPWPELHARLLVAVAAARDGWGSPEAWFRHCLDGLVGYDLTEAASGCRVAMREAGFAVPRKAAGAAAVPAHLHRLGVTAREHDVLRLVAEGLQNKQIAERLYLSVRTVETHVARLLQRTGCADRGELAAQLEAPTT
ncbi:ATP-binding protein [Nocardioides nitrophenolicus]|uniref:ATP-binding protein n=1 Tax=Nocardioides nitrophenolicus TaxID=60489 RepID=UPI0019596724|nr:LuxR family transcriptional regulator [Nocardioides nitrophenolicus]MBM7519430.1 DNA-binding CsgD family transcriptional regulator/tetratricopeptide (TPR) repeat protein [Nocardioides nitrophenolicus]